jgi:hypothetical protein
MLPPAITRKFISSWRCEINSNITFLLTFKMCTFPISSLTVFLWKMIVSDGDNCNISGNGSRGKCRVISSYCQLKVTFRLFINKNSLSNLKVFKFYYQLPCLVSKLDEFERSDRGDGDSDKLLAK